MDTSALTPRKIVVLDDNDIDRETCCRYLGRSLTHHYEFVEHNSVEGALDIALREQPDCILLDYHLHDGNGIEFLHALSSVGGTRFFPVVMLTGTGSESIAVEAMKAGAQDYLVKDHLNPEILLRTVDAAIFKAQTARLLDRQQSEMERLFREAQDANARKDQFLAALSHELRTPLTPVLAAVSVTDTENASPEELREVFSVIRRNIELEARLIDDMLDLARITSGKLEITLRLVDLHEVLKHAAETCAEDISAKQISLHWNLAARQHFGRVDSARLQQVFWNLLKNAVKFTPAGGRIDIVTQNLAEDRIEIAVIDNGIGLDPAMLEKIFDAFEQGHLKMTRQYGGLGLGLAISKALIDAHHGTIRAMNTTDASGARFEISLPSEPAPPEVPLDHRLPVSTESTGTRKPFTLLLVEDHPDSAALLARLLRMYDYEVVTATSVREAVEVFRKNPIQGIISDIGLPDGTGIELMETLRAIRPVPGIALSGYGMESDLQNSLEAGFLRHLTKPVDWPQLEEALEQIRRISG